jgi:hypothetical protein
MSHRFRWLNHLKPIIFPQDPSKILIKILITFGLRTTENHLSTFYSPISNLFDDGKVSIHVTASTTRFASKKHGFQ